MAKVAPRFPMHTAFFLKCRLDPTEKFSSSKRHLRRQVSFFRNSALKQSRATHLFRELHGAKLPDFVLIGELPVPHAKPNPFGRWCLRFLNCKFLPPPIGSCTSYEEKFLPEVEKFLLPLLDFSWYRTTQNQ